MKKDLTVGSPLKLIIYFTIPLLIGNLFQQLYNTADTMIVGRTIGFNALAAVGVTGALVFFVIGFAQGLTGGFSIITAQKFGNKDGAGVRKSVASSFLLSLVINIILTLLSVILSGWLLHIIKTPDELYDNAFKYIVIIFWGTGAAILFNLFSNMLRAIGNSKWPLYFLIIACIVNIVLDYLFILSFKMGVAGAALATVISQITASLLCFEYIRRYVPELQAKGSDWKVTKYDLWEHIRVGIPMAVQVAIIAIGIVILQWALNRLGALAVGAFTVAQRIDVLAVQCLLSFGITMATYTAQNYGAGDISRIRQGVRHGSIVSVAFAVISGILILLAADFSVRLFLGKNITDPAQIEETIRLAKVYLTINCSMYVFLALLLVFRSTLQGLGNSIVPTFAGVMELIMRTVAAIILSAYIGFAGISWASTIALVGAFIPVFAAYFYIIKRLMRKYEIKKARQKHAEKLRETAL